MKINPISFGRTVKIIGNAPLASAVRSIQLVNGTGSPRPKEEKSCEKLQKVFYDTGKCEMLQAISFNNGRTAYVLSGKEQEQLSRLIYDKHQQIRDAISIYGEDSPMIGLVADAEEDKYTDLAKMLVDETCDGTLWVDYNKEYPKINSVEYLG